MTFLWPNLLYLLLTVPLLVVAYFLLLRRKNLTAIRYSGLSTVKDALGAGQKFRRHIPPFLFLLALIVMITAIARPAAVITLPTQRDTVILAMDVSGSMRAVDVEPSRLVAAQDAARTFVAEQPSSTRIGIVAFAGTALTVQPPTFVREDILGSIERFTTHRGTAIGSGILASLQELFPSANFDLGDMGHDRWRNQRRRGRPLGSLSGMERSLGPIMGGEEETQKEEEPAEPGSYQSAAIILLTDGQATTGPDPIEAAHLAAKKGVRVYTVGIGTPEGATLGFQGWSMRVRLDEETLKSIADITRGEYFYAGSAIDLKKIYQGLNAQLVLEKKETEITALFSALAVTLAVMS
ncbi:MAG TPA: ABC transporter ATP-binding protein, partial [Rhodospirillaceae bacterium]|nr:ABC transporter ATP-binding protein [Rhodospirillaceae bacterium]